MVTCCLPFMACGEDNPVSSGTEVAGDLNHVNIIPAQVEGNIEIKEDGIVELDAEDEMVLFPVACDVPVTEDTEISLKIKPIVVDLYNLYHDTNYKQFKQVEILTPKVTIRKGEQLSAEKIRLRITDMSGLYDGLGNHVVPIAFDSLPETFAEGERAEVLLNFRKKFQPNTIKVTNDIPEFGLSYTEGQLDNLKEEITLNNVLQAEKTAQDDIHITLAIDESLVAGYNEQNGTTYLPFPNAALKTENVILAMGSNMANVELKFADKMSAVEYGKKYLIPVVIKEVSGGGAVLGEEQVVYVRFSGETMFGVEVKDQTVGTDRKSVV